MNDSADDPREAQISEVLDQIREKGSSRDALSLLISKLIELKHPDKRVEFVSEGEIKLSYGPDKSHSMFLYNIWAECEKSPDERAEIVERYVRVLAPTEPEDEAITREMVIPIIRENEYRQYIRDTDRDLITRHLIGDLWIVYAIDLPQSTAVISAKQIAALNLSIEELLPVALRNIEGLLSQITMDPYGECYVFSCENTVYASSLLLLDHVWEQAAELVQGDLVVAVPARDTILFAGATNKKGIEELRQEAAYVFKNGNHVLSQTLLARRDGLWKLFQ